MLLGMAHMGQAGRDDIMIVGHNIVSVSLYICVWASLIHHIARMDVYVTCVFATMAYLTTSMHAMNVIMVCFCHSIPHNT